MGIGPIQDSYKTTFGGILSLMWVLISVLAVSTHTFILSLAELKTGASSATYCLQMELFTMLLLACSVQPPLIQHDVL